MRNFWKVHPRGVVGKPDFLFPEQRLAVFVDGCFWHGCPKCGHVPTANNPYWKAKIEGNQRRDREYDRRLQDEGLRVLRDLGARAPSEPVGGYRDNQEDVSPPHQRWLNRDGAERARRRRARNGDRGRADSLRRQFRKAKRVTGREYDARSDP